VAQRAGFFFTIVQGDQKQTTTIIALPIFVALVSFVFNGFN